MVASKLSSYLEKRLPSSLGAYRKGRPTWSNVGVTAHLISEAFERRQSAVAVGLDLQDAYNMVSLPKLSDSLHALEVDT